MSYIRTSEIRERAREKTRLAWMDPEKREHRLTELRKVCATESYREKLHLSSLKLHTTPEYKKEQSKRMIEAWARPGAREIRSEKMRISHNQLEYRTKMQTIAKIVQNRPEVKEFRKICMLRPEYREMHRLLMLGDKNPMQRVENREKIRLSKLGFKNHLWRGGRSNEPYGLEFNEFLKSQIRDRDDHLCQMPDCYLSENGKKHPVHHIDYDKKNSRQENLITLCHSHHTQTSSGDRDHWTELFQELQILRRIGV